MLDEIALLEAQTEKRTKQHLNGVQAWLALGHPFAAHRRHWNAILLIPHL
jgi:hypothetical protein